MKWIAIVFAALALSSCGKNIDNQDSAQLAVDKYFTSKPGLSGMTARVQSVIFRGNEADATVMVSGKGAAAGTAVPIPYVLERKSGGWEVKGLAKNAMAGHAGQNGGQMPAGHPGSGMGDTSGQAMPPGHPAMGTAPGAAPDGSQKVTLPPDHPHFGDASK